MAAFAPVVNSAWGASPPMMKSRMCSASGSRVLGFYEAMAAESRSITAEVASPDAACRHPDTAQWSLRWILLHMIEETARHAGHADIIRESIDGVTGV